MSQSLPQANRVEKILFRLIKVAGRLLDGGQIHPGDRKSWIDRNRLGEQLLGLGLVATVDVDVGEIVQGTGVVAIELDRGVVKVYGLINVSLLR